jgi:hypothetical protein
MRVLRAASLAAFAAVALTALLAVPVVVGAPARAADSVEMQFACALKSNGLVRAVDSVGQCKKNEDRITIQPGPHFVCVKADGSVRRVSGLVCTPSSALLLELPPASGTVYFCAAIRSGVLRYVTDPVECTMNEKPVFVEAAAEPASLTVVKVTDPVSDPQDFDFDVTGAGIPSDIDLDTDAGDATLPFSETFVLNALQFGAHTITESTVAGWTLTGLECTGAGADSSTDLALRTATLDIDAGENVVCTFTNTKQIA